MSETNLMEFANIPPCDWREMVEEELPDGHGAYKAKSDADWGDIADDLEFYGIRMLLLSEYIAARRGGYCGDHKTHGRAAELVQKRHKKLRQAIGFTDPSAGILRLH